MREHFGEPHDRELVDVIPGDAAGGTHLGAGDAGEFRAGKSSPQCLDERGAQRVTGCFSGHQCDAQSRLLNARGCAWTRR